MQPNTNQITKTEIEVTEITESDIKKAVTALQEI